MQPRVERFELFRAALDLELAPGYVCGALAQGPLEILELDELRRALLLALLCEPSREAQQFLPAGVVLNLLPVGVPAQ